jgi:tight adherence protein C
MQDFLTILASLPAPNSADWQAQPFVLSASAATFIGATALAWIVARRLIAGLGASRPESAAHNAARDPNGPLGTWTRALASQLPESRREGNEFRKLLRSAGFYQPHAAYTVYAFRFLLLFVPLVAAGIAATVAEREMTVPILVAGGFAGLALSIVPRFYVFFRRNRRQEAIRQSLPDALDMLSMCMAGGMPLSPSLAYVARRLPRAPELAEELSILRRQAELGSLQQALADFGDRTQLPETRQLASLLTRGDRLGKELSGSLVDQADRLRASRRQAATRRANKAPVKLVLPMLFCFAPAALILLVSPAVLELKEFIAPTQGRSVLSENQSLNTQSLLPTISRFDQTLDVPERTGS